MLDKCAASELQPSRAALAVVPTSPCGSPASLRELCFPTNLGYFSTLIYVRLQCSEENVNLERTNNWGYYVFLALFSDFLIFFSDFL